MTNSVSIAISAFRSDAAIISLLEEIFTDPHPEVGTVIVVDSLGSGIIAEIAAAKKWQLHYENANTNLGSAGNLARRMKLAAETGAEWCLCLNHDANWDAARLSALLSAARSRPRVGAVYPVLDHSPREPRWEDGRRHFRPSAGTRMYEIPKDHPTAEVLWSSSNCALYSTAPISENIYIMPALWMGYEDLAYGIALRKAGWLQLSCRSARLTQVFDYAPRKLLGRTFYIPDKPVWYSYYNIRNLVLIWRQYGSDGLSLKTILWKLIQSTIRTLLFEHDKFTRLKLLYLGVKAGIRGETGKGLYP
ncbi:GT2 family glycosyltransferase [Parvibaculum indicum]|uniref:glycosyltransferase family 2 protein n=1 Tax=Parvibaculum indicum TaxID=562969 RepID=UPI001420D24C|nr:glycosyltransferase [Parvibaculum indicum]NIJ41642.1 GT2 family glycosyltransferase [Parvibaculum indicum]